MLNLDLGFTTPAEMASLTLRRLQGFAQKSLISQRCHVQPFQRTWYCVVAGSSQHTMSVKNRIEDTKQRALLGGGLKRIEKQHQKVILIPKNV